jgi:hypothetical protein
MTLLNSQSIKLNIFVAMGYKRIASQNRADGNRMIEDLRSIAQT